MTPLRRLACPEGRSFSLRVVTDTLPTCRFTAALLPRLLPPPAELPPQLRQVARRPAPASGLGGDAFAGDHAGPEAGAGSVGHAEAMAHHPVDDVLHAQHAEGAEQGLVVGVGQGDAQPMGIVMPATAAVGEGDGAVVGHVADGAWLSRAGVEAGSRLDPMHSVPVEVALAVAGQGDDGGGNPRACAKSGGGGHSGSPVHRIRQGHRA